MFHRHAHPHFGGHRGRGAFGFHGRPGRGPGGRFFNHGDLRFVALKFIAEKPSHGYELIKAVETMSGGAYVPSPGVIYPTLTLLEEMGYIRGTEADGGKRLYAITPEGEAFLAASHDQTAPLFERMRRHDAPLSLSLQEARDTLKLALRKKLHGPPLTDAQQTELAKALQDVVRIIDNL